MSRRRGSATALKASEVVAARGMLRIYSHIGICQALFFAFFRHLRSVSPVARAFRKRQSSLEALEPILGRKSCCASLRDSRALGDPGADNGQLGY